ncbi:SCF ubiquitin ligase complex subunit [Batrachochytrium dendrobatidis]|nr:SCF ubiquitin ligase complex subunit [Batrachochytrium dendrobatidis]
MFNGAELEWCNTTALYLHQKSSHIQLNKYISLAEKHIFKGTTCLDTQQSDTIFLNYEHTPSIPCNIPDIAPIQSAILPLSSMSISCTKRVSTEGFASDLLKNERKTIQPLLFKASHTISNPGKVQAKENRTAKRAYRQLPTEVVMHLITHVSSKRDLLPLMVLNRQFYFCVYKVFWKYPIFNSIQKWLRLLHVLTATASGALHASKIANLNFSMIPVMGDRSQRILITNLILACPNITHLNLYRCEWITDTLLHQIPQSCHILRVVNFSYCRQVSDETVAILAQYCPLIESLILRECGKIGDASLETIAKSGWRYLRQLNFAQCGHITDRGLAWMAYKPTSNDYNRDFTMPSTSICEHNTRFNDVLQNNESDSSICIHLDDANPYDTFHSINAFEQITQLIITKCFQVTDQGLYSISQGCGKLRMLGMAGLTEITAHGVLVIINQCVDLSILNVHACPQLSAQWLSTIYRHSRLRVCHEKLINRQSICKPKEILSTKQRNSCQQQLEGASLLISTACATETPQSIHSSNTT